MKEKAFGKKILVKFISGLIIVQYAAFLFIDLTGKDLGDKASINLKYIIIVFCFVLTLLVGQDGYGKLDRFLVQCAKLFTLAADYYLLLSDNYKLGVLCFCIVQFAYILRHSLMNKDRYKNFLFLFLALLIAALLPSIVKVEGLDKGLLKVTLTYAALLSTSLYCALRTVKNGLYSKEGSLLIAAGMFLFFMCDLNVGLYNILGNSNANFIFGFLMWFFYAPSQLLLSLSSYKTDFLGWVKE